MRILVTGGKGQLASELRDIIGNGKADIGPIDSIYESATVEYVDRDELDITDAAAIESFLTEHPCDYVINCAAYTNVDGCEREPLLAESVNAMGPANLALACSRHGITLLHISTDYVLAGTDPRPQTEDATCSPASIYGKTKLAGEKAIQAHCDRYYIMRTAWLYGKHGHNFVRTVLRLARSNDVMTVVDDQIGNPTNANDLAYEILKVLPTKDYGIYHCTAKGSCSWYELAKEVVRLADLDMRIEPCSSAEYALRKPDSAQRPMFSILDNEHLRNTIGDDMRPWDIALESFINHLRDEGEI